jgi:hypothetical protein
MNKAMYLKVTELCEALPAFITNMWTFSCVYSVVNHQIEIITQIFVAYLADIEAITGSTVGAISENRLEVWSATEHSRYGTHEFECHLSTAQNIRCK